MIGDSSKNQPSRMIQSIVRAARGLWVAFPMIFGTVLLVSLISAVIPKSFYTALFSKNLFLDPVIGGLIGSISAGNPIVSYIFGGEMIRQGVSFLAVTSFLVAWVTVGIIQLPAESAILGRRFAISRNITAFILSIITAIITIIITEVFQ